MYRKRPQTWAFVSVAIAWAGFCTGCSEELGPEVYDTTRVEGTLSLAGKPVKSGFIQFIPAEGTRGHLRATDIRSDGSFIVDGVAVGRNVVSLADVYGPTIVTEYGPMRLSDFHDFKSPIRRDIPSGVQTRLDIDLLTEAKAHLQNQQRPIPQLTPAP